MLKTKMRRIICIVCALAIVAGSAYSAASGVFAVSDSAGSNREPYGSETAYNLIPLAYGWNQYENLTDGYQLQVPGTLQFDSMVPGVYAAFDSEDLRLEIYKENITSSSGFQSYLGYGNRFTYNTVDHVIDYQGKTEINGMTANILQWHRNPLARVEKDKNYYTEVDLFVAGHGVYTLMFKSTYLLSGGDVYLAVAETFARTEVTVSPYAVQYRDAAGTSAGLAGRTWNVETRAVYEKYFSDSSDLTWGLFETNAALYPWSLQLLEQELEYRFPILLFYTNFLEDNSTGYLNTALTNAKAEGRILELTLQTIAPTIRQNNMVYSILDGQFDLYLTNFAAEIRNADIPVLFRLCNEMNGDWCVYSAYHTSKDAQLYVEMYRYIYKFFEKEGINDKLIWVWNPNEISFPNYKWNSEFLYYPGSEYVDVVGITGYNNGTYYSGETWRDFDTIYQPLYNRTVQYYDKPIMITEFSTSRIGGDKEAWTVDMFQKIRNYPKIKVAVWWSGCDLDAEGNEARPYYLNDSDEMVKIFKENLSGYSGSSLSQNTDVQAGENPEADFSWFKVMQDKDKEKNKKN